MNDCEILSSNTPVRQGDIFVWRGGPDRSPWEKIGLILTADCDIAQKKIPGFLTYVPVISLATYLEDVWAERRVIKLYNKVLKDLDKLLYNYHQQINPKAQPFSQQAIERWVISKSCEEIISSLKILNEDQRDKFKRLYDFIRSFLDNKNCATNSKNIYLLKKLKELSSKESPDKVLKKLQSEIRDGLITVPQDVFFICKIPNLKPFKSESLGYFAMLRYIQPLAISSITVSLSEPYDEEKFALRIARLKPTYKFACVHRFANLFSRVGLPQEWEESQKIIIEEFCNSIQFDKEKK